jgi:lysine-specific demethylase/histidyl-hydroxylase NO66
MSRAVLKKRKRLSKLSTNSKSVIDSFLIDDNEIVEKIKESDCEYENNSSVENIDFSTIDFRKVLQLNEINETTCHQKAAGLLSKIIFPTNLKDFYKKNWEKQFLHCNRDESNFFKSILNLKSVEFIVNNFIFNDSDLEIFKITKLIKENFDFVKANINSNELWNKISCGYILKLNTPQKFDDFIWHFLTVLEHEFNCMVTSSITIAPPSSVNSQLHIECTEVFLLQLEGESKVTMYSCSKLKQTRNSTQYFSNKVEVEKYLTSKATKNEVEETNEETITSNSINSSPIEVHLKSGDTLYIPMGFIFQIENTQSIKKSLFLTVQTNEAHSMVDLIELILPQAISEAAETHLSLRKSIPRNYSSFLGIANSEDLDNVNRKRYKNKINLALKKVLLAANEMVDPAVDQVFLSIIRFVFIY